MVSSALRRSFHGRSAARRSAFDEAGTLPPPLCCALVQCAVASCSASVSFADSRYAGVRNSRLRTINHYHCERENRYRQSDGETIGKAAATRLSHGRFKPAQSATIKPSSLRNCSTCLHKVWTCVYPIQFNSMINVHHVRRH